MFDLLRRHKALVVVGVLLLLPLVLLYAQTKQKSGGRGPVVGAIVDTAGVIERMMLFVTGGLNDGFEHYVTSVGSWEELMDLRRERQSGEALATRIAELSVENERLRGLARAAGAVDGPRPLGARVIARTGQPLTQLISIDRGTKDGVRLGDGVVSEDGVVGVVLVAGRSTSDVLLLTDPSSAIDVVVQKTRARGIVRGRGDADRYAAVVEDFDRLRDVSPGDVIVTSGIAARFPAGVLVGTIVDVKAKDDLTLEALVRPASVFARIEHVAVLVGRVQAGAPVLGDDADDDLAGPSIRTPRVKRAPAPAPIPGRAVVDAGVVVDAGPGDLIIFVDGGPGAPAGVVDAGIEAPPVLDAGAIAPPPVTVPAPPVPAPPTLPATAPPQTTPTTANKAIVDGGPT